MSGVAEESCICPARPAAGAAGAPACGAWACTRLVATKRHAESATNCGTGIRVRMMTVPFPDGNRLTLMDSAHSQTRIDRTVSPDEQRNSSGALALPPLRSGRDLCVDSSGSREPLSVAMAWSGRSDRRARRRFGDVDRAVVVVQAARWSRRRDRSDWHTQAEGFDCGLCQLREFGCCADSVRDRIRRGGQLRRNELMAPRGALRAGRRRRRNALSRLSVRRFATTAAVLAGVVRVDDSVRRGSFVPVRHDAVAHRDGVGPARGNHECSAVTPVPSSVVGTIWAPALLDFTIQTVPKIFIPADSARLAFPLTWMAVCGTLPSRSADPSSTFTTLNAIDDPSESVEA